MIADKRAAGRPAGDQGLPQRSLSWDAQRVIAARERLAQGVYEACDLERALPSKRLEAEAAAFRTVRLGLLAARKHADLLDDFIEEEVAPVVSLILRRGTQHGFLRERAKECMEVLLSRPHLELMVRGDQKQLDAARKLGLLVEPEPSPSASSGSRAPNIASSLSSDATCGCPPGFFRGPLCQEFCDIEEQSPATSGPGRLLVEQGLAPSLGGGSTTPSTTAGCSTRSTTSSWDTEEVDLLPEAPPAARPCQTEDAKRLLAQCRNTLRRSCWRFGGGSAHDARVLSRRGFERLCEGLRQLSTSEEDGPTSCCVADALSPLEGHWDDVLSFLSGMYASSACASLRLRITDIVLLLQDLSPAFRTSAREVKGLSWVVVPTESMPGALRDIVSRRPPANRLEETVADLRNFMESSAGTDILYRTHECYLYIVRIAQCCRERSRYCHGSIRMLSSLSGAGAAGTVAVGGIIAAATGGIATPAVVGAITGGVIAGAVSAGVGLANTLTSLGLDMLEARFVESRMEELRSRIQEWDDRLRAMWEAAGDPAEGPHRFSEVANAMASYGMKASSIVSIANAFMKVSAARYDCMAIIAPEALNGAVKAGTPLAQSLMIGFSGVGLVCGLVDAVLSGVKMWRGYCDAADGLDAHADRFCSMLRMMRAVAPDTDTARSLAGQLPWLLLLEVLECEVPVPDYRAFDHVCQLAKRRHPSRRDYVASTYFQVTLGKRRITIGDSLVRVRPNCRAFVNRPVLFRLRDDLRDDDKTLRIQAFDKRGLQSLIRGNPQMGSDVKLRLRAEHESLNLKSRDGSTTFWIRYQVLSSKGFPTSTRSFE